MIWTILSYGFIVATIAAVSASQNIEPTVALAAFGLLIASGMLSAAVGLRRDRTYRNRVLARVAFVANVLVSGTLVFGWAVDGPSTGVDRFPRLNCAHYHQLFVLQCISRGLIRDGSLTEPVELLIKRCRQEKWIPIESDLRLPYCQPAATKGSAGRPPGLSCGWHYYLFTYDGRVLTIPLLQAQGDTSTSDE
jgi:hypothetical protein